MSDPNIITISSPYDEDIQPLGRLPFALRLVENLAQSWREELKK